MATPDTLVRIKVEDRVCEIDVAKLTLGEMEEAEIYFDKPLSNIDWSGVRGTIFLAYLARKRVDPGFSLDDVRQLTPEQVTDAEAPKRPTKPRRKSSGTQS